jgi:hypothetical protein
MESLLKKKKKKKKKKLSQLSQRSNLACTLVLAGRVMNGMNECQPMKNIE